MNPWKPGLSGSRGNLHICKIKPTFRGKMICAALELANGERSNLIGLPV